MSEINTNSTTQNEIDNWVNCVDSVEEMKRQLDRARTNEVNQRNKLGKLMCPKDAKDSETFSIWSRKHDAEMLLVVEKVSNYDFNVYWRK
jgi:hypothetical protein